MGSVGAPWLVFIAVASWRWTRVGDGGLPRPAVYVGSSVIYSLLGLAAQSQKLRQPAVVLAWALVAAQAIGGDLLNPGGAVDTGNTPTQVGQIEANTAAALARQYAVPKGANGQPLYTITPGGGKGQPGTRSGAGG